jgi:hypothetical protein
MIIETEVAKTRAAQGASRCVVARLGALSGCRSCRLDSIGDQTKPGGCECLLLTGDGLQASGHPFSADHGRFHWVLGVEQSVSKIRFDLPYLA